VPIKEKGKEGEKRGGFCAKNTPNCQQGKSPEVRGKKTCNGGEKDTEGRKKNNVINDPPEPKKGVPVTTTTEGDFGDSGTWGLSPSKLPKRMARRCILCSVLPG